MTMLTSRSQQILPGHTAPADGSTAVRAALADIFLDASASLTGFSVDELRATGLTDVYLDVFRGHTGNDVECLQPLLAATRRDVALSEPQLDLCRSLVALWYLGTWLTFPDGAPDPVPSPRSYEQALVWKAFGASAPGTRAPGFGSWTAPPVASVGADR